MNTLLIVRSEIIAIFILVFFLIYNRECSKYRESKDYFKGFAISTLGHTIFALITEITVNLEGFPSFLNNLFHIIFFVFALLFSLKYFEYVLSLIVSVNDAKVFLRIGYAIALVSTIVMIFAPIYYLQGNGTKYSAGLGATICYALAYLLIVLSDVLIILCRKRINRHTVWMLIPISIITLLLLTVQIIIPEFLFSGCASTITTVGLFFAIENPIGKIQSRAFLDIDTQLWNRNCYEHDLTRIIQTIKNESSLIYVLADINELKRVNDTYGHLEGDVLIKNCVEIIMHSMPCAFKIYRIGGDEFAMIYKETAMEIVKDEVFKVYKCCKERSKDFDYNISVSIGYSKCNKEEELVDAMKRADVMMYEEKKQYYKNNGIERRTK
ncbi:MAG: GGDEF domain-containing protein [Lachnospiraceae bacterium]